MTFKGEMSIFFGIYWSKGNSEESKTTNLFSFTNPVSSYSSKSSTFCVTKQDTEGGIGEINSPRHILDNFDSVEIEIKRETYSCFSPRSEGPRYRVVAISIISLPFLLLNC